MRFIGVSRELLARGLAGSRVSWMFTQSWEIKEQHQPHPAGGQPAVEYRCAEGWAPTKQETLREYRLGGAWSLPDITDEEIEAGAGSENPKVAHQFWTLVKTRSQAWEQ